MWPSIRRWHDWASRRLFASSVPAIRHGYEKAGLIVHDQPIPWNADAVLVEASIRLAPGSTARASDFVLALPGNKRVPASALRFIESEGHHRVEFRLPPLTKTTKVELRFRDRELETVPLPYLSRDAFLADLALERPTLFVRLRDETVACRTFVPSQCRGLMASVVVHSSTNLLPLADLDFHLDFRCEQTGSSLRIPARLTGSQLTEQSTLLTLVPRRRPRHPGAWLVSWLVDDHVLARQRIKGISKQEFLGTLGVCDTRFVVQRDDGPITLEQIAPPLDSATRTGPCFVVTSSEPGMAGRCTMRITAQVAGAIRPPLILEQDVVIADGPTPIAPGTLDAGDLAQVSGFELHAGRRSLGKLMLSPAPPARFTCEGGFEPPPEYHWTAVAEEEMEKRLRLLEVKE